MKVIYYGHSCFGVETEGKHLLFDPFITFNPLASKINVSEIPADFIIVSHAHQDHTADTEAIAKRTGAMLISNYEICMHYAKKGITNFRPLNTGGSFTLGALSFKCVNATHSSCFDDGSYGGNPNGYVVSSSSGSFYFAGDTGLTYDMRLIGDEFKLDFAMLPVGDNFTMGIADACKACDFIVCSNIIAMHYNTFDPIKIDIDAAKQYFEKAVKKITFMEPGETKEF